MVEPIIEFWPLPNQASASEARTPYLLANRSRIGMQNQILLDSGCEGSHVFTLYSRIQQICQSTVFPQSHTYLSEGVK